jgi:dethiobiotin synthetase
MQIIVTGTGTDVGKTVVAAALTWKLAGVYWKPVQTGGAPFDTELVQQWTGASAFPPRYQFPAPLSPHAAARRAGKTIDEKRLYPFPPHGQAPLIIEGAGGVLVPLNAQTLMIDLFAYWKRPVVVVASSGLGTINHTLLTLEALRQRSLVVLGVVLNGHPNAENAEAIRTYGQTEILGEIPLIEGEVEAATIRSFANVLHVPRPAG